MMRRWLSCCVFTCGVAAVSCALAAPETDDFAEGIPLRLEQAATSYQLLLPEPVYGVITRADLGDLRVFNGAGEVVQHALCDLEDRQRVITEEHPVSAHALPLGRVPSEHLGTRLDIETPDGISMKLHKQEAEKGTPNPGAFEYILDARHVDEPVTGLRLDWQWFSPEGRAELPVRIAASDDLDQWRTVVDSTTLLRIDGDDLATATIALPEGRYRFLRLIPGDERARDWLEGAAMVSTHTRIDPAPLIWEHSDGISAGEAGGHHDYRYHAARPAPVQQLRLVLPGPNRVLSVRISSRPDESAGWRHRFSGQMASGPGGDNTEALTVDAARDPFWRVEVLAGGEALGNRPVELRLGYRLTRLGFLAQGEGPYLLAYGSRRVPPAQLLNCAALGERPAEAYADIQRLRILAGEAALRPIAEPTPLRLIVLWGVLGAGALLVVAMAISLLRKLDNR